MVQPTIDKLASYVDYYVHRVIGLKVRLNDSPQPCSINIKEPIIELPMSKESLGQFLGKDFVDNAPIELLFAIVIGLAYHEAAHLKSGEKHVEPHILDNVINDVNDFTFVPDTWKGSIPFTISLINTTYRQGMDLSQIPLSTREEKLQALIHLAVTYMRKLRIRLNGKDSRSLPKDYELIPYFEKITPIMRLARKATIAERPELVQQLYNVLKDFWDNSQAPSTTSSLDQALDTSKPMIAIELTGMDAEALRKILEQLGTIQKAAGELNRTAQAVVHIEAKAVEKKTEEAIKRIRQMGDLGSKISEATPDPAAEPVTIDQGIVRKLRQALKPLLFERSVARRKPAVIGTRFAPSHFHEIKTKPEEPRIRQDVLRIGKSTVETEIILCFDRSGSMGGSKETVCKEVAGSFFVALESIRQAAVKILGFDTEITIIKNARKEHTDTVLRKITTGLSARGGTDFPLALCQALKTAEKSTAHKKIIFMLTDGDLTGTFNTGDLVRYAKHLGVLVYVIGITGSNERILRRWFGKKNILYIEDVSTLPEELTKKVMKII
jgi:hypothetical protein